MLQYWQKEGKVVKFLAIKDFNLSFYEDLINLIKKHNLPYVVKEYKMRQTLFPTNAKCEKIGIILAGEVSIEHEQRDGRNIIIKQLQKYQVFGEILLFSPDQTYPYTIIASSDTKVLFIDKKTLLKVLSSNEKILANFLSHSAKSYMILNKYIKMLTQKHIINKLAYYLIHYATISDKKRSAYVKSKTALASFLGIERQSLIRTLNELKAKNILDYDLHQIYVKDITYLKNKIN